MREPVFVGTAHARSLSPRVDQARVALAQHVSAADARAVHRAGREVLDHDVRVARQAQEQLAPALVLEVRRDRRACSSSASPAGTWPARRAAGGPARPAALDLDHVSAREREQQPGATAPGTTAPGRAPARRRGASAR